MSSDERSAMSSRCTVAESASARLSRLLSVVPWLEQHPGVSVTEAAAHFGVTAKDFENDLWLTICCGLPGHGPDQLIDIQFWDEDGSIHVIDPQTLSRPLRLSGAEAMSLLVGLRLLAQVPGDHDRSALASVTAKLEGAVDIAHGTTVVVDDGDPRILAQVERAVQDRRAVRIVYAGASRDEVTERIVEPAEVLSHTGRAYLSGWCREAGAMRTFRLDRIRGAEVLDEEVTPHSAHAQVPPASGVDVRLRLGPSSRWFLEGWDAVDVVSRDDGGVEATLTVADVDWLARVVLGQGGGAEVLGPESVRALVVESGERVLRMTEPG